MMRTCSFSHEREVALMNTKIFPSLSNVRARELLHRSFITFSMLILTPASRRVAAFWVRDSGWDV